MATLRTALRNKWFISLLILALLLLVSMAVRKILRRLPHEGFTQDSPFVSKHNADIYDSYYAMIYDDIYKPKPRAKYEYQQIIDMTHPTTANSVFLDIGSGTGTLVNELTERGYEAHGIDKSKAMVDVSLLKHPDMSIKCGDAMDSMVFDRGSFTHITCMNFTLYEMPDKALFFRNCHHWLVPNGYLILHLADRTSYNPVVPGAVPKGIDNPQKYSDRRITDSAIDFREFTYKNSVKFGGDADVVVKETFRDARNGNVRENENILRMNDIKSILYVATQNGFLLQSMAKYNTDDHQFIYILEKIQ